MSVEPFNRLVKLAARAFYDEIPLKGDNQLKTGRSDNKGIAVVILDALTRRQWVREEDLGKDLKLHSKQLRQILWFFEEEKLITRDHRTETAKGAKVYNTALAATSDGQQSGREGDERLRCIPTLIVAWIMLRYRLHCMRKKLKDELDDKNKVQEYICPNCRKRYTALDAGRLVSMEDYDFHCKVCDRVLVADDEKLVAEQVGDAEDNARRRNHDCLQDKLNKIEVEVAFSGIEGEKMKSESANSPMKVLPPWMIKQGMYLTSEQRGAVKEEAKMDVSSVHGQSSEEKNSVGEKDDEKKIQDEYFKAYYAAIPQRQQEQEEAVKKEQASPDFKTSNGFSSNERQVGMKSKRDDDNDGINVEWEEARAGSKSFKITDLDVQADASDEDGEEEDEDIWEDG